MYKSFQIRNFRCFEELKISPLASINLIAGKNNVGKTALLEAFWLHYGYYNPELPLRLSRFRGLGRMKREEFYQDIFHGFDRDKVIELVSENEANQQFPLRISFREQYTSRISLLEDLSVKGNGGESISSDTTGQETTSPMQAEIVFEAKGGIEAYAHLDLENIKFERPKEVKEPSTVLQGARRRESQEVLAERFGELDVAKQRSQIVKTLRVVEPRLQDLTVIYEMDTPVIYGDIGAERLMALPFMGDGVSRLLEIALSIPKAQNGAVLIDEIENGLHYSVMKEVWEGIGSLAAKYNTQIYATTHSYECAQAAYKALANKGQDRFAFHRLERVDEQIKAVTYDLEMLEAAFELDVEVR